MKHGKKYMETAKAVDRTKLYDPDEAIALVKKAAVAKFDEEYPYSPPISVILFSS